MENLAGVERRARELIMSSLANYAPAVEHERLSRRRMLMVGAIVAKLAHLRRSTVRRGAPEFHLARCHQTTTAKVYPLVRAPGLSREPQNVPYKQFTFPQGLPYVCHCSLRCAPV